MPAPSFRPLALAAALLIVLAGCGGEAEPLDPAPAVDAPAADPVGAAATASTGGSWGLEKGGGLPGDEPDEGYAEDEPDAPAAPVVRAPEPTAQEIVDRDDHVDFALDFLGRQAYNSVDGLMGLYASRVRYFDRGTVSRGAVADDKAGYFERWPNRYYELSGPVRATAGSRPVLRFDYDYAVSDFGGDERTGRAWVELGLTPSTNGYVIASERGGTY